MQTRGSSFESAEITHNNINTNINNNTKHNNDDDYAIYRWVGPEVIPFGLWRQTMRRKSNKKVEI